MNYSLRSEGFLFSFLGVLGVVDCLLIVLFFFSNHVVALSMGKVRKEDVS